MQDPMLPLESSFGHILAHLALVADPESASLATALAQRVGRDGLPYRASAISILCAACDHYRQRGAQDLVDAVERLIQSLKKGQPRLIQGAYLKGAQSLNQALVNAGADGARIVALEHPDSDNKVVLGELSK